MKAREFLARKVGEGVELRNVIKEPLSVDELRRLASRVGGVDELVAPKRRAEAEGLHGEKLLRWLAADGARLRRPIVVTGSKVTLGFSESAREELDALL
jgi:arsenate reductase-like glutaredoxin family protein